MPQSRSAFHRMHEVQRLPVKFGRPPTVRFNSALGPNLLVLDPTDISAEGAHRAYRDDRSARALAVKPRASRAASRLWGLTAQRDRANPAAMLQCVGVLPFELKTEILSDIVRQVEYWFSQVTSGAFGRLPKSRSD
jgi:hypothetical protein